MSVSVLISELHQLEKQLTKLIESTAEMRRRIAALRETDASPHTIDLFVRIADGGDVTIAEMTRCVHETRSHISHSLNS